MKGRFAPSPTGHMHVGNIWVAFLSYWSARRQGGEYIVRIEDVDTQRSKPMYAEHILEDLAWLGFTWDEEPTYQSQRVPVYEQYLMELQQQQRLYPCYCNRARLQVLLIKESHIMCMMGIVLRIHRRWERGLLPGDFICRMKKIALWIYTEVVSSMRYNP